ncbi:MAG: hypothetical protein AB7G13_18130 [Lautropia sp.]
MIRESTTAVIARNDRWSGAIATEPYEAGWATEALVFVRALAFEGVAAGSEPPPAELRVQVSADGMRWIDEGTRLPLPRSTEQDTFARVVRFGNWLRIAGELPAGVAIKALVTLHLK